MVVRTVTLGQRFPNFIRQNPFLTCVVNIPGTRGGLRSITYPTNVSATRYFRNQMKSSYKNSYINSMLNCGKIR